MRILRSLIAPTIVASLVLGVAACGGDDSATDGGKVKLTVATFGEFGYKPLYDEYMKANPNVEITERVTKAEDHHKNLATHLATNTGAADIEAIEEGWVASFTAQPGKFVNFMDFGGADIKAQWPEWKWTIGSSKDGQ